MVDTALHLGTIVFSNLHPGLLTGLLAFEVQIRLAYKTRVVTICNPGWACPSYLTHKDSPVPMVNINSAERREPATQEAIVISHLLLLPLVHDHIFLINIKAGVAAAGNTDSIPALEDPMLKAEH